MYIKEEICLNKLFTMPRFRGIKRVINNIVEWE
jgi:hypothetical protein